MSNEDLRKPVALYVFAKAPIAGRVKTRLAKTVGNQLALTIQQVMLELIVKRLSTSPYEVYVSADQHHPFFDRLTQSYSVGFHQQCEGDLGVKMLDALTTGLLNHRKVMIIGGDVPAFDRVKVQAMLSSLDRHEVALTPAEDGGYVAIACRSVHAEMFDEIKWGQTQVLKQQVASLTRQQLSYQCLDSLWDVDEEEDLKRCFEDDYINSIFEATGIHLSDLFALPNDHG